MITEERLEQELEDIFRLKEIKDLEVEDLSAKLEYYRSELDSMDKALAESVRISRETESDARRRAERLLAGAEAIAASKKAQIAKIESEIDDLEKELEFYNQLLKKSSVKNMQQEEGGDSPPPLPEENFELKVKGIVRSSSSIYTIKLVSFLNARHFVSFGGNPGPVHAHSWQTQIEVRVPAESTDLVAFAKIFESIKTVLSPFEDVVLNHVHPFNKIQPTTENMALYLFNRLEEALLAIGLGLSKISLWETPTKGIEVDNRYPDIDALIEKNDLDEAVVAAEAQAAATVEDNMVCGELPGETGYAHGGELTAHAPPEKTPEPAVRRRYRFRQYAAAFALIVLAALACYHPVLFPPVEKHYPWGSDSWGHLFKAEYLYNELVKGNYYPQFTEYWYNGSQPFRYWAPLPYYALALLRAATGDIFIAGNFFVVLCALFGGLSWLLLAGRMGLWPAAMAGVIWVVWQDNVRVAFSEGNLPRALATALLPLIFILFLNVLEKRKAVAGVVFTGALIHLVVICHAMIAAVYSLCLMQFAFFLWVFRGCGLKDTVRGGLVLAGGIATASWWLLPSMTGGITRIDPEAVKTYIQFVPASVSFDPLNRFASPETFYWGISIIIALGAALFSFRSKPPWAKSLVFCGITLVLITFPIMRLFYITLPLSHLIWPLRFTSFAALAILASSLAYNLPQKRIGLMKSSFATGLVITGVFTALFIDSLFSANLLAHTGSKSFSLMQSAEVLRKTPGWRVATIDLSRLGSAPSFVFSDMAGLEQVFGWAWQGAVTSTNIMLINTGLEMQYYPFLFRSCLFLGATELVVKDDVIKNPEEFRSAAARVGYRREAEIGGISVWHSLNHPYLVEKKYKGLVLGKYAGVVALQFPELEMATSKYIDDYSLDHYKKYPVVIFTGAEYWSKSRAEEIVSSYAASGGRVYVEMAGMPPSVLSKQPEFLGVNGEAVMLRGGLSIYGRGRNITLQPFSREIQAWKAYVPLKLDEVDLEFSYYGNQAPVFGYKKVSGGKVGFLGGNISYHSFLTGDPAAINLMSEILGLKTDYTPGKVIPLTHYRANEQGYVMGYNSDRPVEAVVPVAFMEGIKVELDGNPLPADKFENLVLLNLPAGKHEITIHLERTPVYHWGGIASAFSAALILAGLFIYVRRSDEGLS